MLITGTSTGIGRACALHLARKGFSIWAGVRTPKDGDSLLAAGVDFGGRIRPIHIDVTDARSIEEAQKQIREAVGDAGLLGLVNNAGICQVGPVECIAPEAWRQQMEVNFIGVIAVTQAMLPLLRLCNNGHSRIVNMGSITGEVSTPMFGAYSASKFALRAMTDALRLELGSQGIGVSLIVPGTIQSKIWQKEKDGVDAIDTNPTARRIYGNLIDNVASYVFSCAEKALPAERVAQAVHRAMTDKHPRIEYRVGWEAQVGSRAKQWIPARMFDFLLGKQLGVPRDQKVCDRTF